MTENTKEQKQEEEKGGAYELLKGVDPRNYEETQKILAIIEKEQNRRIDSYLKKVYPEQYLPEEKRPISCNDLFDTALPPQEWIIDGLIPHPGITFLSGHPGSGKSWILLAIIDAVSTTQKMFLDKSKVRPCKVLYVDEEESLQEVQRRLRKLDIKYRETNFLIQKGIKIDEETDRQYLLDLATMGKYKLVIFDSFSTIHGKEENSAKEMAQVMSWLREFPKRGVSVLLTHHHRKEAFFRSEQPSQALRGSSLILAQIDSLITIEKKKEILNSFEMVLRHVKSRCGPIAKPFVIEITDSGGLIKIIYKRELEEEALKKERAKEIILATLTEGEKSRKELLEILLVQGISQRSFDRAVKELDEEGMIVSHAEHREKKYVLLPNQCQPVARNP